MTRRARLEMTAEEFRAIGHRLVDDLAASLAAVPNGPVTRGEAPQAVRDVIDAKRTLPKGGRDASSLIPEATASLFEHALFNGHPRFFGYITSSPAPIGMFADFLAAALNQNAGAWKLAPLATEIELQTVRWIAEFLGYPVSAGGLLVSGGNMANFVCLLAARAARAPWNVREEGVRPGQLVVYASTETHTWIQKAVDLSGLGTKAIRWIPVDRDQRMDTAALRDQIVRDQSDGLHPLMVVGTAGTVSTGAIDPLPEIASICREHGVWFHVDGAYGALAAALPDAPEDLTAIALADSVAVDPHKWLYAPLEAGCVLVRDAAALRQAFSYHPAYYHFEGEVVNFFDYGPQNSRGFRALKVWLALQQAGRDGYVEMIGDDIRLARRLRDAVAAHPSFEVFTQSLSITTFRYIPDDLRATLASPETGALLDDLNQRLLTAIEASGTAFLSNAVVGGKFALRACIVNFHTSETDVDALPELIAGLAQSLPIRA
jgi:glutamate/tyrosine decarboxylase-like PLP-dependent enzyme